MHHPTPSAHACTPTAQRTRRPASTATSHTPGPWIWDGNTLQPEQRDPDRSQVHTILDADGGCGFLGSDWRQTCAELDADRRLIAAAPELLEALRELRDWYEKHTGLPACAANAAIARATGLEGGAA